MWTRKEIKNGAKRFLGKHYLKAFFISLIITMAGGSDNAYNSSSHGRSAATESSGFSINMGGINVNPSPNFFSGVLDAIGLPGIMAFTFLFGLTMVLILWAFRIFVGIPLEIGGRTFFLRGVTDDDAEIVYLASVFKSQHYLNIVKTMFLRGFYNFLWFLLLIIPGIVKHYAYKMVPYILIEEPDMDADQAIQKSIDMTNGQKMDLFFLDLSFIGWYFLGGLLFGLGIFFVNPYYEATYAQLYRKMKDYNDGLMAEMT
ncbi:MAG: DUF975 family protein [Tindallia sp. MSAO_Bac2]|nr:MAG: DUF975 family protein [Tindallia sp. MSAO_Bac2]